jgi:diacylglycerol kinase
MEKRRFSWKERGNSFSYAWQGIKGLLRTEHNSWIHLGLTLLVIPIAIYYRITRSECMFLIIVMAMVWAAELFNTALEKSMDFISKENHPQIKLVKDLAAAAVLISALAALAIGAIIFIPRILGYLSR